MNRGQAALVLRGVVEILALIGLAVGGYLLGDGVLGYALAIGLPAGAATVWAIARVPGDPGEAIYPVPGVVRFALELGLFTGTVLLLVSVDRPVFAAVIAVLTTVQYGLAFERVAWLLGRGQSPNPRDPRA